MRSSSQSQLLASILWSQKMGGLSLGHLQVGLIFSEITLVTGLDSGNLAACPNNRSWHCRIMQVTWLIPVSW